MKSVHSFYKKISLFASFASILVLLVSLSSCDRITGPYTKIVPEDTSKVDTTKIEKPTNVVQKAMITEYTGMFCGNCPPAAKKAHDIHDAKEGKVILLTVHAGDFAKPTTKRPLDLRTTVGNQLDGYYRASDLGNPNGDVNRIEKSGLIIGRPADWSTLVDQALAETPTISIALKKTYNEKDRKITIDADLYFLEETSANMNIVAYLVEDSVVGYQLDYLKKPSDDTAYVHNNVLRDAFTGAFGTELSTKVMAKDSYMRKTFTYTIPANKTWRLEKLRAIVFVADRTQKYRIRQVEEIYIGKNE